MGDNEREPKLSDPEKKRKIVYVNPVSDYPSDESVNGDKGEDVPRVLTESDDVQIPDTDSDCTQDRSASSDAPTEPVRDHSGEDT
jgi:hypothetical protein